MMMTDREIIISIDEEEFDKLIDEVIRVLDGQRYDTAMQVLFASIHSLIDDGTDKTKAQLINDIDSFVRILRHHYGIQESRSKH